MQGRKLEFSSRGIHDADVPVFSMTLASPIRSVDDGLILQGHVDVLVIDSSTVLEQFEAPKVVATISSDAVDDVVVTNYLDSPEEGVVIGDLYVSYHRVAPV